MIFNHMGKSHCNIALFSSSPPVFDLLNCRVCWKPRYETNHSTVCLLLVSIMKQKAQTLCLPFNTSFEKLYWCHCVIMFIKEIPLMSTGSYWYFLPGTMCAYLPY